MESFKDFLKNKLNEVRFNSFEDFEVKGKEDWEKPFAPYNRLSSVLHDGSSDKSIEDLNNDEEYGPLPGDKYVKIEGKIVVLSKRSPMPSHFQKKVIKTNIDWIQYIKNPTLEIQKYIIKTRPDLIGKINNLDPVLRAKYTHELNTASVDI